MLTYNALHESKAAEEGESNPQEKKPWEIQLECMPEGRMGLGTVTPTAQVCLCAFGVAGTQRDPTAMPYGAGYVPAPRCMVPGDASRDVHKLHVSPWDCPSCLVG